jgi:hypothetical protein
MRSEGVVEAVVLNPRLKTARRGAHFPVVAESVRSIKIGMIHFPNADFALQCAFLIINPRCEVLILAAIQRVDVDRRQTMAECYRLG